MESVLELTVEAIANGHPAALVSPIKTSGSLPTGRNARMLVLDSGACFGTVGGGRMEALAQEAATESICDNTAKLFDVSLTAEEASSDGLLCGGSATFLIEPVQPQSHAAFKAMAELTQHRQTGMEAVRFDQKGVYRLVVGEQGRLSGTLGGVGLDGSALDVFDDVVSNDLHEPMLLNDDTSKIPVYLNALRVCPLVCVFGAGHVGQAVACISAMADFRVLVVDDRAEFANRDQLPMVDEIKVCSFDSAVEDIQIDDRTFVVIMTRGHAWDRIILEKVLRKSPAYIGMIGSRRKIGQTYDRLKRDGFSEMDLRRVCAPIGLDIGGDTPGEIAVGVVAQMIQVRYRQAHLEGMASTDMEPIPWDVLLSGCR